MWRKSQTQDLSSILYNVGPPLVVRPFIFRCGAALFRIRGNDECVLILGSSENLEHPF